MTEPLLYDDALRDEALRNAPGAAGPAAAAAPEVTFLHTADWQLGMTRHFLPGPAQAAYDAARHEAVVAIGALAAETGAEFVVVCGDVFDDPRVGSRVVRRTLDALADYPVPVYLLPGNHDPLDATSIYRSETFLAAKPDNVHVLEHPGVVPVRAGVSLIAAPWTSKAPDGDLVAEQLARLTPGDGLRIAVGHGGLDELSPSQDPAVVAGAGLRAAVGAGLVDYVALGDRHSVTPIGDDERIWYAGAPEVTDFDHVEKDSGQVLAVTLTAGSAGRGVRVQPHRVGRWTFTFTLEYVRGGRLGRSSAVRGVARQSPVVAGGLAWKVTPDRDGSFRPLIEMCSRTCRCVKVCRRNHPDEPTAHGRTVWTKRSG